jgi:hypothetical protein
MPSLITDEMLERFAVRGTWAELPDKVIKKYDGLLDRVSTYFPARTRRKRVQMARHRLRHSNSEDSPRLL